MSQGLYQVIRHPQQKIKNPPLLVLLHGYGSNEMDLFSFAEELPKELLIVSLRAPFELGYNSYAWYAINLDSENNKFSDIVQAKKSISKIAATIEELKSKYDTDPNNSFLLGFSQGAILSYALSFHVPNTIQHVIALSGFLHTELLPENLDPNFKTDYYISHGSVDQVIPVDWARKAPKFLSSINLQNTYQEYPVGHGVNPENFFSFKKWIENRL